MKRHEIKLFVMPGCQLCPQMESLFHKMHENGAINELEVINVAEHPELAEKYHIRSVPYYFIDGVGFSGLKPQHDIEQILQQDDSDNWKQLIVEELSGGELAAAEKQVREHARARDAMMQLLGDAETALVVRIGLSAIIETLAEEGLLRDREAQFIELAATQNPTIGQDALYYLSLLGTDKALQALTDIASDQSSPLQAQAAELLQEMADEQRLH
jgi:glutaredoxin